VASVSRGFTLGKLLWSWQLASCLALVVGASCYRSQFPATSNSKISASRRDAVFDARLDVRRSQVYE
jgi:hypothetical protein